MKAPKFLSTSALALVPLVCMGVGNAAFGDEPTFAKLQTMCKDVRDPLKYGYCVGFVEAIALRIVHDNKGCTLLQSYIDHTRAGLSFPDLIADLNPREYSGNALEAVEKFFINKGCT